MNTSDGDPLTRPIPDDLDAIPMPVRTALVFSICDSLLQESLLEMPPIVRPWTFRSVPDIHDAKSAVSSLNDPTASSAHANVPFFRISRAARRNAPKAARASPPPTLIRLTQSDDRSATVSCTPF